MEIVNKFNGIGYTLEIDTAAIVARIYRTLKTGRVQLVNAYRFSKLESMIKYLETYYNDKLASIEAKKQYKEEKKTRNAIAREGVNVGDVFCYSWGWEQTNIDFYQVVEKQSASFIVVRPIHSKTIEETGWASDRVKASINSFKGVPERVKLCGNYFTRSCGNARKVENPNSESFHRSWYA